MSALSSPPCAASFAFCTSAVRSRRTSPVPFPPWHSGDSRTVPKFLEPQHVERLLGSCDRSCPVGRRDYAVLLLLARLGLRAGEVVHMELDDLDWERGELMVRGKSLRNDRLPIPRDVGEALASICATGLAVRRAAYFSASTRRSRGLPVLSPSVISSDGPLPAPGSTPRAKGATFCAMASLSGCSAAAPRSRRSARS